MADEVSDLRLFTRIVAAGSLSGAARRANTSLTSVSRRLSGLENRLGVRLIDRGSRKFTLTDEGQLLHERAVPIVQALDAVAAELSARSRPPQGLLRVSAPHEIGRRQISGLCRAFAERHPKVRIELTLTDVRPDILETELDVAIQTKRPLEGEVVYRKLLSSRRVICAAPSYLLARGRPNRPEDLAHHNCLCVTRGARIYDQWTVRGPQAPVKVVVSGSLTSNNTDTIHRWALDGAGVAIKALWDIEDDLRAGRLVELLPAFACDDIHLYATHFTRRHVPPRIRAFIDFLVEHLPTQGAEGLEPSRLLA
ncbi:LysR family transcriptional regulator [Caulobacter sp. S45]|uniref:LysR family transcriptional regulator n=1 Tax=Caulobacter sp. S45 TaxID=1641861 RepID=UPI0015774700|nr:LysR family transcriptional regulator [Caulobacter sp. S45]